LSPFPIPFPLTHEEAHDNLKYRSSLPIFDGKGGGKGLWQVSSFGMVTNDERRTTNDDGRMTNDE
jgi:hypothetical protein